MPFLNSDGIARIRIIRPGVGSSGFYPEETLKRDGPRVFKANTHMYLDHPSATEDRERPERSVDNLVGVLATDAQYEEAGPAGPGLYADARFFGPYRGLLEEKAPYIGMSIRAQGRARPGKIEGKQMPIIEELVSSRSVDVVTLPGAGGQIMQLFESIRKGVVADGNSSITTEDIVVDSTMVEGESAGREPPAERIQTVTEEERQAVLAENARLTGLVVAFTEAQRKARSLELATEVLGRADLPPVARVRIAAAQALMPVLAEDGTLNEAAYTAQIEAAANAEVAYVKEIRGPSGAIVGMGGSTAPIGAAQLKESFRLMYKRLGKSEEEAERMATVAAQGR